LIDLASDLKMLKYETIPVTPFQQNCSVVWCDQTRKAAVIDPGGEIAQIMAFVAHMDLTLEQIWITHGHLDHAAAAHALSEQAGIPIIGPEKQDQFWIDGIASQGAQYGFDVADGFVPTRWLQDGDQVTLGQETLQVIHCPGHTPGHVVFYSASAQRAFVGDVLFAGSIGRTDFPRGDHATLIHSITQKLWPLGNETVFIPGHGPESTFGRERVSNPYVGGT
jgi:hydroxyacylglutathione hydrolase